MNSTVLNQLFLKTFLDIFLIVPTISVGVASCECLVLIPAQLLLQINARYAWRPSWVCVSGLNSNYDPSLRDPKAPRREIKNAVPWISYHWAAHSNIKFPLQWLYFPFTIHLGYVRSKYVIFFSHKKYHIVIFHFLCVWEITNYTQWYTGGHKNRNVCGKLNMTISDASDWLMRTIYFFHAPPPQ